MKQDVILTTYSVLALSRVMLIFVMLMLIEFRSRNTYKIISYLSRNYCIDQIIFTTFKLVILF